MKFETLRYNPSIPAAIKGYVPWENRRWAQGTTRSVDVKIRELLLQACQWTENPREIVDIVSGRANIHPADIESSFDNLVKDGVLELNIDRSRVIFELTAV